MAELKWADGYSCKKCGATAYTKGKQPCSRRCSKCCTNKSETLKTGLEAYIHIATKNIFKNILMSIFSGSIEGIIEHQY